MEGYDLEIEGWRNSISMVRDEESMQEAYADKSLANEEWLVELLMTKRERWKRP